VAIAYVLTLDKNLEELPFDVQHGSYKCFEIDSLLGEEKVHLYTKWYFESK